MPIRAVIVDDELWARKRLRTLLSDEADVDIVAECSDGEGAIRAVRGLAPDVVFLDVHMPDISGCEVLDAMVAVHRPVVIFVTAYDRYAVEAFERDAVDYLLKPFDESRFRASMARARRELTSRHREGLGDEPVSAPPRRFVTRIAVQHRGRVVFVRTAEIDIIEAAGNYVSLRVGADTFLARISMTALDARLDPDQFARIHRSTIVNLDRVREVLPWSRGEQMLVLTDGRRLTIGRAYRRAVANRFMVNHSGRQHAG